MTILLHFDNPHLFTVLVDGQERARIRKMAENWRLFRTDQTHYSDVDVTDVIRDHRKLKTIIRAMLKDEGHAPVARNGRSTPQWNG